MPQQWLRRRAVRNQQRHRGHGSPLAHPNRPRVRRIQCAIFLPVIWDSRIRCHYPTASVKAHRDRAGCASAAVETQGGERSAAALWTRITIGTSEPASCASNPVCYLLACNMGQSYQVPLSLRFRKSTRRTGPDVPQQRLRRRAVRDQQRHCGRGSPLAHPNRPRVRRTPYTIVSRSWFPTSGRGQVGGRLSRNRHLGRTVSVKGCKCLSDIEINRERSRFSLIYFHLGAAFVPLVSASPAQVTVPG